MKTIKIILLFLFIFLNFQNVNAEKLKKKEMENLITKYVLILDDGKGDGVVTYFFDQSKREYFRIKNFKTISKNAYRFTKTGQLRIFEPGDIKLTWKIEMGEKNMIEIKAKYSPKGKKYNFKYATKEKFLSDKKKHEQKIANEKKKKEQEKLEAQRKEEQEKLEAQQKAEEEKKRLEQEKLEAQQKAEEEKKRLEQEKLEAQQKADEEKLKLQQEIDEQKRKLEEEKLKLQQEIDEQKRKLEEEKLYNELEPEYRKKCEKKLLNELFEIGTPEYRTCILNKGPEEQLLERKKIEDAKKAEEKRIADEKKAEEKRKLAEQKAKKEEEKRLAKQKEEAEKKRIAEEKKKAERNYIEIGALTCKNENSKQVFNVKKNSIQTIALYTKMTGINKNVVNLDKSPIYELKSNTKNGFEYSVYSDIFKETYVYKYNASQKIIYMNGKKHLECIENDSHSEPERKAKTNIKMSEINSPFDHAKKFKWDTANMACDLNGGVFIEFSNKNGEELTINGKKELGVRREVYIKNISNTAFNIETHFFNNSAMFSAYGDKYPVSISNVTYTLTAPDKMNIRKTNKMADFNNLNVVSYTTKNENTKSEICD